MVTISGRQPMVSHRGDHGEGVEVPRNRKGSESTRRDGKMIPGGGTRDRRAEMAQTAEVAETAGMAETVSRFVGGR